MNVPFLDLSAQHAPDMARFRAAIDDVIAANAFAGGPFVERFEDSFARFCGVPHAAGVGSGTEALWFALLAFGIGPGDEVIVPAQTFIATAEAVSFAGARPVFVDVCPDSCNMDPDGLEAAVTPRTKAVIPVHLFGQTADMDPILAFSRTHGLRIIEDASQAHGAAYRGRPAGSMGDAGCFSFYPGKNLGAFGEAGAVVSNDGAFMQRVRELRDHGQVRKYRHAVVGWNGRMDGIQAAVLDIKLAHLHDDNNRRRRHAAAYARLLQGLDWLQLPKTLPDCEHVWHLFVVRVPDRDAFIDRLADRDVATGIHYPIAVHLQEAYRSLGHSEGDFPNAEAWARNCVSLPMFPTLTATQLDTVAAAVKLCAPALAGA